VRTFGALLKLKKAWILRLTTVCPTSTQKEEKLNKNRGVAQLGARDIWEREQTPLHQKIKSAKKPCNTGIFGTLQNLKKA